MGQLWKIVGPPQSGHGNAPTPRRAPATIIPFAVEVLSRFLIPQSKRRPWFLIFHVPEEGLPGWVSGESMHVFGMIHQIALQI
jgi:hypothetical protein